MRRMGYALLYIALTAMSVAMFFLGEPLMGIAGVLLFGGGGVIYLLITRMTDPSGSTRRPTVARYGRLAGMRRFTTEPAGVVFPGARGGAVLTLLGAAVFVLVGSAFIYVAFESPDTSGSGQYSGRVGLFLAGLVSIAFFGGIGALVLRALIKGGNGIVLVADGVYFRAPAGRAWVRWDDLNSVCLRDGIQFLAHTPELITLTSVNRWLHGINRRRFGMDVGYPTVALKSDPDAVVNRINYYRANPHARAGLRHPASVDHHPR